MAIMSTGGFPGRSVAIGARAIGLWAYILLGVASLGGLLHDGASPMALRFLLDAAYGWWVALTLVFVQVVLGRWLLGSWLKGAFSDRGVAAWLASFTLGFWLFAIALTALASLGLIDRLGRALWLLAVAIVALRVAMRWSRSPRQGLRPPFDHSLVVALTLVAVGVALTLPFIAQSLLPNSDWDAASTHLPLATWLRTSGLEPIPIDYGNLIIPGTVHLVYALLQAIDAEQAIIPLNLLVSFMTCLAAASIASRFWGRAAGLWGFGVCFSINILMELGLDARIDGFLAFFCSMAALGLMIWLLEGANKGALIFAAIAFGNALGSKYTAIFPLALWGSPVLFVLVRQFAAAHRRQWRTVLIAAVCLLVPSGYGYMSNAIRFGDPIYPFLSGRMLTLKDGRSVQLESAIDELVATVRDDVEFRRSVEQADKEVPRVAGSTMLFDPISLLFHPERHTRKRAHFLSPLLLLFLVLPIIRRSRASWLLFWMGFSAWLTIGVQTYLMRYGLAFYPIVAAGSGVVLASFRFKWWQVVWAVALAVVIIGNVTVEWRKLQDQQTWSWLSGERTRIEWLSAVGYNETRNTPMFIRALDAMQKRRPLQQDGRLLMIGEAKTHLLGFDAIPDTSRTGLPWLSRLVRNEGDLDGVHRDLWDEGVRYILVNRSYFSWVRSHIRVDLNELMFSLRELERFTRAHGEVVLDRVGIVLIRLKPPARRTNRPASM
ncbi:MAG: hypothetical protein JRE57_01985 [Deltaproteobacteria bacterium]|nr:hypothetical protein [Deltaproteobacteria bacterium]